MQREKEVDMALVDTVGALETILTNVTKDLRKIGRGNKSAAQRIRVSTIRLEKLGKLFRKESMHAERASFKKKKAKKKKR